MRSTASASSTVHEEYAEYPDTPVSVRNRGDIEFTGTYIEAGSFGSVSGTIHEKA